jgi:hypothetical protein
VSETGSQSDSCLAELAAELTALDLKTRSLNDEDGRPCLEVYDRYARARRVYVVEHFYWFLWGDSRDERHSVFKPGETAIRLARLAHGPGWPPGPPPEDLSKVVNRYLR